MNVQVKPHQVIVNQDEKTNAGEYNVTICTFEFSQEYDNLTKMAVFSTCEGAYKVAILNNQCTIPIDVLKCPGSVLLGVCGYESDGENLTLRYSPEPQYFLVNRGSYQEGNDPSIPPRSEWEELVEEVNQAINETNNLNITAEKEDGVTTITITHKDDTEQTVEILDGEKGDKGDKGDPGAIKFEIVETLPTQNIKEDTIYLVPITPDTQGNNYAEYIYVNGQWELLGKIGVQIDLTNYVQFTDIASSSKTGVIKSGYYGLQVDSSNGKAYCDTYTYANYGNVENQRFISKGTLENVITGKGLVNNTSYASDNIGGVIKTSSEIATYTGDDGILKCRAVSYQEYNDTFSTYGFISQGTLENVITGKDLTTKAYVDSLVGDIETILTTLDVGSGVSGN